VLDVLQGLDLIEAEGATPRIPIIEAWNKWDLLPQDRADDLEEQIAAHPDEVLVPLSAATGSGVDALLAALAEVLTASARPHTFAVPVSDGQRLAWLHAHGEVLGDEDGGEDERGPLRQITVRLDPRELGRFIRL
jgi:GTP-binding protein HflX